MQIGKITEKRMSKVISGLLVILVFAGWIEKAAATPILSPDGSLLSGLDVGGTLYDVMFGDGLAEEVYGTVNFDAARLTEANAVSAALLVALNSLVPIPGADDINGCDPGISCWLFNPDDRTNLFYTDDNYMEKQPLGPWQIIQGESGVSAGVDSARFPGIAFVTYARSARSVSTPAPLALLGAGLAALGFSRRKGVTS
jgi:hypothetical protein